MTGSKPPRRKIVLLSSNPKYVGVPLSLLSITKLLDLNKYDVKIITKNEYPHYEAEVIKQCDQAICLGISVITGSPVKIAKNISQKVKQRYPHLPIIWGGWFPTTLPRETLKAPYVDYVCMGQGDMMFSQFVNAISQGKPSDLNHIPRLGYKKGKQIILNERLGTEDIQKLPDFNMNLINWEKYLEVIDFGKKAIRITTSYGCPYRCAFCCEPINSKRLWKAFSAARVINFLKKLRQQVNFDALIIVDSNFFVDENRVARICKGLIRNKFKIKLGQVNGRTNNLVRFKPQTWKLMKKAGLYNILIGAESASENTLTFINKDATVNDTLKLAKLCHKYKILILASVIVGLPTPKYFVNNKTAFQEELNGVIDLYNKICTSGPNHHLLTFPYAPLPLSPLYNKAIQLGFKPPATIDDWSDYEFTQVHIPWIPQTGYRQLTILNFLSLIAGIDFKYFLSSFPSFIRLFIQPPLQVLQMIGKWRIKHKAFYFPLDIWAIILSLRTFTAINKRLKLVNIGS